MSLSSTSNIFVSGDSDFTLLKCMCNNISIEKIYMYEYCNFLLSCDFINFGINHAFFNKAAFSA